MDPMKQVGSGFKTVYTGLMLKVLAVVVGLVGAIVLVGGALNAGAGAGGVMGGLLVLLVVVGALNFTGAVLELIGRIKCLAIPQSLASAKQLIIATVCLQAIAMIITVVGLLNALAGPFLPLGFAANIERVNTVFWIASEIIFLLFIKAVARGIRRSDLVQKAGTVLTLSIILIALYVVMIVLTIIAVAGAGAGAGGMGGVQAAAGGAMIAGVLGLAILVLGIITLILYARLLLAMQVACNKYAYNAAYDDDEEDDDYDDDRPRKRRRDDDDDR